MKVTRVTEENAAYFEDLAPSGALGNEHLLWLGAIAGDGTACALLAAGICEDAAYIDWIYTHPAYRRQSAAGSLLRSLRALLRKTDIEALLIDFSDENENLEDFLEAKGFFVDEDIQIYSVPLKALIYSEMMERFGERLQNRRPVSTLDKLKDPELFYEFIRQKDIPLAVNTEVSYEDSLVMQDRDGNINGCMLLNKRPEGDLEISYLENDGSPEDAVDIFLALKELVIQKGWEDENLVFSDRNGQMADFVEQIAGEDGNL